MITKELVHVAIARIQDKNADRIASWLSAQGHTVDMNAIRDVLGEAHPDLRDDGKMREPKGRRITSRNHMKRDEGIYVMNPRLKPGGLEWGRTSPVSPGSVS